MTRAGGVGLILIFPQNFSCWGHGCSAVMYRPVTNALHPAQCQHPSLSGARRATAASEVQLSRKGIQPSTQSINSLDKVSCDKAARESTDPSMSARPDARHKVHCHGRELTLTFDVALILLDCVEGCHVDNDTLAHKEGESVIIYNLHWWSSHAARASAAVATQ